MKTVWWEKYRPTTLDEFVGQQHLIDEFAPILNGDAPLQNYIFYSKEPGTGKTTLAHIIAKMLGYQIHQYNASSKRTRGIEFIEEDIIPLSRSGLNEAIIFLDEADRLTQQAQDALKGVIESSTCRFILTCNDITKVSTWLQSRCQVKIFEPIQSELIFDRLKKIGNIENIVVPDDWVEVISKYHNGDVRNSIGAFQSLCQMDSKAQNKFILSMTTSAFDSETFLRLCFRDRNIAEAYKMFDNSKLDSRKTIRTIFEFGVETKASNKNKITLIDASVTAERDLLNGVNERIAVTNYIRLLVGV